MAVQVNITKPRYTIQRWWLTGVHDDWICGARHICDSRNTHPLTKMAISICYSVWHIHRDTKFIVDGGYVIADDMIYLQRTSG